MKILIVDDEQLALDNIWDTLKRILPEAKITGFTKSSQAIGWLQENDADIALLDIEMNGINGITLAKRCSDLCHNINIIFVTAYSQYTMDALQLHASGYLIKPVAEKELLTELKNLRHPLFYPSYIRAKIQTFGNFEIFVDQEPLYITGSKCKECLAYLVDRKGTLISFPELASILWEDRPYDRKTQNNIHRVISDMMKCLKKAGIEDIIIKRRNGLAINMNKIDCDYYNFLNGNVSQINSFCGEYMSNYSWAEFTLAGL